MDRERQTAQSGVGADIARRLLAADMLFARGKREHIAALAGRVDGFARQAAWHLAQELFPGCEQTDIGSAEIQAVSDGLAFRGHDVGVLKTRRFEQAERYDFGDEGDEQCAFGMRGGGDGFEIADEAEYVRA